MPERIGIVADDLTGATTVGALIAREGVAATVLFDADSVASGPIGDDVGAVIVSTDSRAMEPEVAFHRVRRATEELQRIGVGRFSKRIDTTSRGAIGPEVEGMLTALGEDFCAIVVPAMPQSRRIVVGGYSIIDSTLLARTEVARDVRTPVTESHIPTLLRSQLTLPLGHVELATVLQGEGAIRTRLDELCSDGVRVIVVDAVSSEDVDSIAGAVVQFDRPIICVDPGPFTDRVAVRSGAIRPGDVRQRGTRVDPAAGEVGTVLAVAGSATRLTHDQIEQVRQVRGTAVVGVSVERLLGGEAVLRGERDRVVEEARTAVTRGPAPRVLVLALDPVVTGRYRDLKELEAICGLKGQQVSALLNLRFGELARQVLDLIGTQGCAGLYLTGGDVMLSSCRALDAVGITLVDYVIPQVDQGVITGGPYDGLPVVCKGGLTGAATTALESINRIFDERMALNAAHIA